MDRPVIDLCWKIAHGVLYTAERLSSFGYAVSTDCFCGLVVESLEHLFFSCPLAQCVVLAVFFNVSLFPVGPVAALSSCPVRV